MKLDEVKNTIILTRKQSNIACTGPIADTVFWKFRDQLTDLAHGGAGNNRALVVDRNFTLRAAQSSVETALHYMKDDRVLIRIEDPKDDNPR